jgi:UDP-glucose 4-epimerase|tara:strand:- start:3834 stop:4724 length:891 start_codon:yes stop_codon:yes gene_type:complete
MISIVTGGCGFIGSHVVDRLVKLGHEVRVIDDLSAKENERFYYNDQATYWDYDISKIDCSHIFDNVDYVFHLAARSRIQPTIGSPNECFEVNVVGTQRVLEWSRLNRIKRVIYSGTSSLYGKQNPIPFEPNMPADCLNPYSMSKWMGEQVCKLYHQLYGLPSITLRYFNVYGPREPLKGEYAPVIGLFKRQSKNKQPMTIVAPGTQKRDFTYIDDVVEANICAIKSSIVDIPFGIYNVGTGINYSIIEISDMIGGKKEIISSRPAEVNETLADIELTTKELGWKPKYSLINKIMSY